MRTASLPLAVAAGLIAWSCQPVARADDHAHPWEKAAASKDSSADWKLLLASLSLGKEDRALLERLRPYLAAEIYHALDPVQRKFLLRYARNRFEGDSPLARCWSPDTPNHILLAYHAVEEAAQAGTTEAPRKANQFFQRWSRTATNGSGQNVQGRPITLTWSIVPDDTPVHSDPAIGDSSDPSNLRARLAEIYGGDTGAPENQPWFHIFQDVFANISAQTGINYLYEPNDDGRQLGAPFPGILGTRGDIRLSGHDIDGDRSTLAYTYFPDKGDMVIDTNDNWFENLTNNSIRLANTVAHEHGHGIGMEHVCPIDHTKLLEPFINTSFRGLQFDDIYTLQRWYGDPFEQHGNVRDNDSVPRARPLPVSAGSPFGFEWLSIDDNTDVDYYSVMLSAGSQFTARVIPSSQIYPEGAQSHMGGCPSGTPFDSTANHNLTLELLDQGSNVIASATANPAGQLEEIVGFVVPSSGRHYLRVDGGAADLAQLYRLEVEVASAAVAIALQDRTIVAESHAPANGKIEPGETIELEVTLINNGSQNGENVQATLTGPPGFTGFTTDQAYGLLPPTTPMTRSFIFALEGDCGEGLPLQLSVTADGGFARIFPLRMSLGTTSTILTESFDTTGGPSLPVGWTSSVTSSGGGWDLSTEQIDSPAYSVFAEDLPSLGTSALTTPSLTLGALGGVLRFRHNFDTEANIVNEMVGYDGGVLEISVDGGAWQDILTAGAQFMRGGYNRTLSRGFQNPLPNRPAWSGNSGGWITTVVRLPPTLGSQPIQLRWRLGHDTSVAEEGWFLDRIELTSAACDDTAPVVNLALDDDSASEFAPLDLAQLTFSTDLPPVSALTIPLLNNGTATLGLDATGLDNIILPAGQTSVQVSVHGVNDFEVEGDETLVLSIDPAGGLSPAGLPTATITISDTPYGQWAATTLGLGTQNGPLEDRDHDGALNLEEYAWHTDGASPSSRPNPAPRLDGGFLRADAPLATLPSDVSLRAEASTDLQSWGPSGIEILPDGFRVPLGNDSQRYLRFIMDLIQAP